MKQKLSRRGIWLSSWVLAVAACQAPEAQTRVNPDALRDLVVGAHRYVSAKGRARRSRRRPGV